MEISSARNTRVLFGINMRTAIKRLAQPLLKIAFGYYYQKPRKYSYEGIVVDVHPEVFPPHFTLSTKILLEFLKTLEIKNRTLLELGCGTGIIALSAASKGAKVTASDINPVAISCLYTAAQKNNLKLNIIHSDLFDAIEQPQFDFIIINPPYYPKEPKSDKEKAWFCGQNFEYFKKLFLQLSSHVAHAEIIMILSEDCNFEKIKSLAIENKMMLKKRFEKKVFFERNVIYSIMQ